MCVCVCGTAVVKEVKKELLLNKQFGNYVACLIIFDFCCLLSIGHERYLFSFHMNRKERKYLDDVIGR